MDSLRNAVILFPIIFESFTAYSVKNLLRVVLIVPNFLMFVGYYSAFSNG